MHSRRIQCGRHLVCTGICTASVLCRAGKLKQLKSDELKETFKNPESADKIAELADSFVSAIREGKVEEKGWSTSMYGVSKLAETSYTMWLSRQLDDKVLFPDAMM